MVLQRSRLALDKLRELRSKIILESVRPETKAKKMAESQRSPVDVMIDKLAAKGRHEGRAISINYRSATDDDSSVEPT